jgi:tetratricopeptide (TPR) repeat protein
LLLVDWWMKRPLRIVEKLPLFALAAAASVAAWWAHQQSGSVATIDQFPLGLRLANAVVSYVRYLWKTIWPVDLAVFYPMPATIPASVVLLAVLVLAAITWLALRSRAIAFGWAWYLLTLLPVIGIVQTGMQSMADRYMYLPMIGLFIGVVFAFAPAALPQRSVNKTYNGQRSLTVAPLGQAYIRHRGATVRERCRTFEFFTDRHGRASVSGVAVVLSFWGVLTWRQIRVWQDGVTLFAHAIQVTEDNFAAHDNLGVELDRLGRGEEALAHYREAIRIRPGDRNSESNYAQATFAKAEKLFQQGQLDDALALFNDGMPHAPRNAMAHTYAGLILMQRDRLSDALAEFRLAVAIDPNLARAHIGLGVALARSGDLSGARKSLGDALRIDPANAEAKFDLNLVEGAAGK